jgi:hypothetical protein
MCFFHNNLGVEKMEVSTIAQKYTDALTMLERTSWPGVELDNPQAVEALSEYAYAILEGDLRRDAYKSVNRNTHPNPKDRQDEKVRLYKRVVECDRKRREKLDALRSLVGDEDEDDEDWYIAFRAQYDQLLE